MNAEIADRLWQVVEPAVFINKEEFLRNLDGWDVRAVEIDGEPAFITMTRGPAFHFQSLGTGKRLSSAMIREFLLDIIDRHGYATTKTPLQDERQHRFNLRYGFHVVGEDEFDRHYRIERLPHG